MLLGTLDGSSNGAGERTDEAGIWQEETPTSESGLHEVVGHDPVCQAESYQEPQVLCSQSGVAAVALLRD